MRRPNSSKKGKGDTSRHSSPQQTDSFTTYRSGCGDGVDMDSNSEGEEEGVRDEDEENSDSSSDSSSSSDDSDREPNYTPKTGGRVYSEDSGGSSDSTRGSGSSDSSSDSSSQSGDSRSSPSPPSSPPSSRSNQSEGEEEEEGEKTRNQNGTSSPVESSPSGPSPNKRNRKPTHLDPTETNNSSPEVKKGGVGVFSGEERRKDSGSEEEEGSTPPTTTYQPKTCDLVWTLVPASPTSCYPALVSRPSVKGYSKKGITIPGPPIEVIEQKPQNTAQETYLVLYFDKNRSW
jgi:hypothetical protein